MIWSADVVADDWKQISSDQVIERALDGLKSKGRGILLLHDIHERTVEALPKLLSKLKLDGFHIVHVVPVSPDRPKTVTGPTQWTFQSEEKDLDPPRPEECLHTIDTMALDIEGCSEALTELAFLQLIDYAI